MSLNIVKYFKMSLNIVKEESSLTNIVTKPSLTKGRFQKHKNYSFYKTIFKKKISIQFFV